MVRPTQYIASALAFLSSSVIAQMFAMYTPGGDDTSVQRIDPIISPGGISGHVHQVFGANKLTPTLDYDALQSSICTTVGSAGGEGNAADHSIYWHPALYMESSSGSGYIRVPTNGHKMYYLDAGTGQKHEPFEFPHDFRMVAGNPFARSSTGDNAVIWKCSTGGSYNVGSNGGFPTGVSTCSDYPYFYGSVEFPHCWNGNDYNPSDPSAHMSYPTGGDPRSGACPSSHPIRLPHLFIENFFNIDSVAGSVKPDSFVLAQGDDTGFGMHCDFFNGWEDGALPTLLSTCPQPQWGNEDVGTCSNFKSSGATSGCKLPVQYKENVDTPGQFLPGCNPISNANPAPQMAIAALGMATDTCKAAGGGGGSPSPSGYAPSSSGSSSAAGSSPSQSSSAPVWNSQQTSGSSAAGSAVSPYASYVASSAAAMTTLVTTTYAYSPAATQTTAAGYGGTTSKHGRGHPARPTWAWGGR